MAEQEYPTWTTARLESFLTRSQHRIAMAVQKAGQHSPSLEYQDSIQNELCFALDVMGHVLATGVQRARGGARVLECTSDFLERREENRWHILFDVAGGWMEWHYVNPEMGPEYALPIPHWWETWTQHAGVQPFDIAGWIIEYSQHQVPGAPQLDARGDVIQLISTMTRFGQQLGETLEAIDGEFQAAQSDLLDASRGYASTQAAVRVMAGLADSQLPGNLGLDLPPL
ncbi:hypothetical protein PENSPDRAFT_694584 [Peniophora sp. CONT]|nr:hypothetical protein PENSPDRAFT_694584 [Peniophora sp. CONT]